MNTMADGEREKFEAWAEGRGHDLSVTKGHPILIDGVYEDGDTYSAWATWQASIAARQPVGAAVKDSLTVGGEQAVGHRRNPLLAYADSYRTMAKISADGRVSCESVAYDIEHNMAPHAQAVDLGQFRELAREMDRFRTKWKTVSLAEFNHYADRLLALIDSKAVGK